MSVNPEMLKVIFEYLYDPVYSFDGVFNGCALLYVKDPLNLAPFANEPKEFDSDPVK